MRDLDNLIRKFGTSKEVQNKIDLINRDHVILHQIDDLIQKLEKNESRIQLDSALSLLQNELYIYKSALDDYQEGVKKLKEKAVF